MVVATEFKFHM